MKYSALLAAIGLTMISSIAQALAPKSFSYQAVLTDDDGALLKEVSKVVVRIYDAKEGGTLLYRETHNVAGDLSAFDNGVLNIIVGTQDDGVVDGETPTYTEFSLLPFDRPYFMQLEIDSNALDGRMALTSVPYALNAPETISDLISQPPSAGNVLKFNGADWIPAEAVDDDWQILPNDRISTDKKVAIGVPPDPDLEAHLQVQGAVRVDTVKTRTLESSRAHVSEALGIGTDPSEALEVSGNALISGSATAGSLHASSARIEQSLGIGVDPSTAALEVAGTAKADTLEARQLISTTKGVPPLKVSSDSKVANLNAEFLDGHPASAFLLSGGGDTEFGGLQLTIERQSTLSVVGKLEVANGGAATVRDGGTLGVEGALSVPGQATVVSGGNLSIESGASVDVQSGGTLAIAGVLNVPGQAVLQQGGNLSVKSGANLDVESGGAATIEGGGTLAVAGALNVPGRAAVQKGGGLSVESGASLDVQNGGTATVKGGGTLAVAGVLSVPGEAAVQQGGNLSVKSGANFDVESGGTSTIEGGGTLAVAGALNVPGEAAVQQGGSLSVESGANLKVASGGTATVEDGGLLEITGSLKVADQTKIELAPSANPVAELNADFLDGLDASAFGAKYTAVSAIRDTVLSSVDDSDWVVIHQYPFVKEKSETQIEIQLQSVVELSTASGGSAPRGVQFRLQVGAKMPTRGIETRAAILLPDTTAASITDSISLIAYYGPESEGGLIEGTYNVDVLAKASAGVTADVVLDPQKWGGGIVVKEVR